MVDEKKNNKSYYFEYKVILYFLPAFRCHCGEILTEHVGISHTHNNTDCLVPEGKWDFLHWYTLYNLGGFYSTIKQWNTSSIQSNIISYMVCI